MRHRVLLVSLGLFSCVEDPVVVGLPPTAFAGFDSQAVVGQEVSLDASQSLDPDGDPLSFSWALVARPEGSTSRISPKDERLARFVPDRPGTFVVALTVFDGLFEDRDLVGIQCSETDAPPEALSLELSPQTCNTTFGAVGAGACSLPQGRIVVNPIDLAAPDTASTALSLQWNFVRLPAGISAPDLQADLPSSAFAPMSFVAPRPGAYWISARLAGQRALSAPAFAAIEVFESTVDLTRVPQAGLQGPRTAKVRERVILDARTSVYEPDAQFRWSLLTDPSEGTSPLEDRATGCPPQLCQRFTPVVPGTYVVRLDVATDTATGAPALWSIEVEP